MDDLYPHVRRFIDRTRHRRPDPHGCARITELLFLSACQRMRELKAQGISQKNLAGEGYARVQSLAMMLEPTIPGISANLLSNLETFANRLARQQRGRMPVAQQNASGLRPETKSSDGAAAGGDGQWNAIEILFLSEHRVQISNGATTEVRNFAELGLADGRTGNPNLAWATLKAFALGRGIVRDGSKTNQDWPKVEKQMQALRKTLRQHFGITADPIPFIPGTGYQARFKSGCSPAFDR